MLLSDLNAISQEEANEQAKAMSHEQLCQLRANAEKLLKAMNHAYDDTVQIEVITRFV